MDKKVCRNERTNRAVKFDNKLDEMLCISLLACFASENQIMNRFWTNIKGFKKKYIFCMLSVVTAQILAIYNLKTHGYPLIYPLIRIKDVRI